MWIARDKSRRLKLWQVKPRRGTYHWHAIDKNTDSYYSMVLDPDTTIFHTYKFIGFEDEPIEVELIRKKYSDVCIGCHNDCTNCELKLIK